MSRIFGSPGRYIQGPDALDQAGPLLARYGPKAVAVIDPVAQEVIGEALSESLCHTGIGLTTLTFGGEITAHEIETQTEAARAHAPGAICAVGGGKAIDTGKGVADTLGLPLIVIPTIASNDAPTSTLIVIYDQKHRVAEVRRIARSPDIVLVDSKVIAQAPARFLRAGIADGLSKTFEAGQTVRAGGRNFFDGHPTAAALALADRCYTILREDAQAALEACEAGKVTQALENVIEAAVLLSGLGFENGGLSITHALLRGLTAEPALATKLHGELVAYALLVQLRLERRPDVFIAELEAFYDRIGLPRSLMRLGMSDFNASFAEKVASLTMEAPYIGHFERPLSSADIVQAMAQTEAATG